MYSNDYHDLAPATGNVFGGLFLLTSTNFNTSPSPYVEKTLFDCPSDSTKTVGTKDGWGNEGGWGATANRSYALNQAAGQVVWGPTFFVPYSYSRATTPSTDHLVFDFENGIVGSNAYNYGYEFYPNMWGNANFGYGGRHNDKVNLLLADGHVENFGLHNPQAAFESKYTLLNAGWL
ncbi:hypothetical protein SDC9_196052 [bioreactor metagenome]|uniref:Uncharacterized protein n=1 Tax=bioreactor metagenome TaxID=1076179 RepID=A0A645IB10_9ZZZZ